MANADRNLENNEKKINMTLHHSNIQKGFLDQVDGVYLLSENGTAGEVNCSVPHLIYKQKKTCNANRLHSLKALYKLGQPNM